MQKKKTAKPAAKARLKKKAPPAEKKQSSFKRLLFGEEKPDLTELESGSTTILVAVVKGENVTVDGINAAMKAAASDSFQATTSAGGTVTL